MFGDRLRARRVATTKDADGADRRLEEVLALYDGAYVVRTPQPVIDLREHPRRRRPIRLDREVHAET